MRMTLTAIGLAALGGCASIAGEHTQPLTVHTVMDGKEIAGAGCTLANDAGKWSMTTPGSVMVHKSTGDLAVDCAKEPALAGHKTAVSKANGVIWGNLIVGGAVGYVIDRHTGAGFDYPQNLTVTLRTVGDASGVVLDAEPAKPPAPHTGPH
jgi:hypothetical protein